MFDTVNGLPAHPLFIHIVVVLLPLSAIGMIALVVIPQFRGKVQKYFVASGVLISLVGAFIAKESGAALQQTRGVTDEHHDWGNRTFYLAIALTLISALWLWLDTKPKSLVRTVTGILVVVISLAAVISTVLAGDSGATQVWEDSASSSTISMTADPEKSHSTVDPEVTSEPAATSEPVITVAAVAGHNSANDCWAIVNGSIYDLTQWISAHPGGSGPIESICGVDATAAFTNKHGGQGAPEARLASFKIGFLG